MGNYLIIAAVAYLCGSIPFGYILVRVFVGKDIRKSGSGNIGATNVARTAPGLGLATLLLDALKGYLPVMMVPVLMGKAGWDARSLFEQGTGGQFAALQAFAALCAVLGHIFPVWLKFRGGKGVATAVGALAPLSPLAMLTSLGIFIVVLSLTRYVSLSSICAAIAFPVALYFYDVGGRHYELSVVAIASVISAIIISKHHANIRRLLAGSEHRFGSKTSTNAKGPEAHG